MKPMAPPMRPMEPTAGGEKWWPDDLGHPSTRGSQNGMRYAYFPGKRRLLIDESGKVTTYDSGDRRIGGVSQQDSHDRTLALTGQNGTVKLGELSRVG